MKVNITVISLLVIATFLQFFLKIAYETTLLSYIAIVLILVPRTMFAIKLFGIPAPIKAMYTMEAVGMALPSLFFFLAIYNSERDIYWGAYAVCVFISLAAVIMYAVEDTYFIYEETEITGDDE
jgi:hypothetical protein